MSSLIVPIYFICAILGLYVAINYLLGLKRVQIKDLGFALCLIFLNIPTFIFCMTVGVVRAQRIEAQKKAEAAERSEKLAYMTRELGAIKSYTTLDTLLHSKDQSKVLFAGLMIKRGYLESTRVDEEFLLLGYETYITASHIEKLKAKYRAE